MVEWKEWAHSANTNRPHRDGNFKGQGRTVVLSMLVRNYHVSKKLTVKVSESEWKSLNHVQLFATLWTVACPGSSVHGIFQARIPEWVAIPFSRESSQPRDQTQVNHMTKQFHAWVYTWKKKKKNTNSKRYIYPCVHSSFIYSWWDMGTT